MIFHALNKRDSKCIPVGRKLSDELILINVQYMPGPSSHDGKTDLELNSLIMSRDCLISFLCQKLASTKVLNWNRRRLCIKRTPFDSGKN